MTGSPVPAPTSAAGLVPRHSRLRPTALAGARTLSASAALAQTPPPATLPEIKVRDSREADEPSYKAVTTRVGKTAQELRDIAQSVTVVTEELMYDRNADTLREALRNVAGLTFNAGEGGRVGDNITLRGYSAVGDLYLDGIRDIAQYNRDTFNYEQIDVLRGSASMLFGRGSTGGVINQVSKTPFLMSRNSATATLGSFDFRRFTADINQVVAQDTAVRVNVMATDNDSYRDEVQQKRWGVAPSVRFGAGTANDFTLAYYYLRDDNIPDFGVPYFQGRPLKVPVSRYYGLANADYENNETGIATATYVHRFGGQTEFRSVLRHADYERDMRATAPRLVGSPSVITDSSVINRQRQARGSTETTLTSQNDFTTIATTGPVRHEILVGLELMREEADRWNNVGLVPNPPTTVGSPNATPDLPDLYYSSFRRVPQASYVGHTVGVYAQDTMQIGPQWKLNLGARFDRFNADYDRIAPLGDLERTDRVPSWRAGLIWQPDEMQSYYVSYGTSFNPSAEAYQLDDRSANTDPEKNRNIELGAKWELLDGGLSLRSSISRSEKTNERNTDLSMPDVYLLSGKRHTDSFELEAIGRLTPAWEVFASAAWMNAEVDVASGQQGANAGKRPPNTPRYTASLWTTYRLAQSWKVGGGIEAVGDRYANPANTTVAPAYTRVDALLEYSQERYDIKLNAFNLFNTEYYEGVYQGHILPGTSRAFQVTGRYKF